jgi:hypothetical protein
MRRISIMPQDFTPLKVSEMIENKNETKDQNMFLVKYCESERINTEPKFGKAKIEYDSGVNIVFSLRTGNKTEDYAFSIAGHESWVETLKYCQRNNIDVRLLIGAENSVQSIS